MSPKVTRRSLLAGTGALLSARAQSRKRLNVLFIVSDDLTTAVSVNGSTFAKTPNLERLARHGITFDHAYCQYPLCQPSRTSFLSGLRPATTKVWTLDTPTRKYLGDHVMLPELFRKNGYFTGHYGKIFHTGDEQEDPRSWDEELRDFGKKPPKDQILHADKSKGPKGHSFEWDILKTADADMPDGVVARRTVAKLEELSAAQKPFFIGTGFRRPHAPYAAPKKYFDLFPSASIPLPETRPEDFNKLLPAAINYDPPDKPLTEQEVRTHRAAYYACVSFMDAQLGLVLDAVDRLKLWDSTAVVFCGDNGYHLGEHGGLWHKSSLFEEGTHVPLLVSIPGMRAAGRRSSRLVELIDLYPTLAEAAGLQPPTNLEGTSLRPLLDDPTRPWKKGVFAAQGRGKERTEDAKEIDFLGQSVRTDKFRYVEWDGGKQGLELYDEIADPHEINNLANDPKHDRTKAMLRDLLLSGWKQARP